ncbi:metal-dependent hydrolase [Myxococcus sp. MISCRS1]|uniref:metal-dependent hydrolase n=1 Tax=Myxococcus sp. MISCRS1 TaxID=2996786 RepID=UPI00226F28DA|nr:metal-dependent hydrolase [Myxococcus sp. MISCRS1]MCY0998611.1 metal-dependent hydrolase [Myxococcus sp. MISCRS1]
MNPIVHAELAWLTAQGLRERRDRILVTCAGLAPDLDGLTLLGGEEWYARYHHVLFHGYVGALVTTAVCVALARQRARVAVLAMVAFHLHLVCDLAGSGPGWPIHYYWPTSMREWFWQGQWDLSSWQNSVIGLFTTLAVLACALGPGRRTFVEVFSARWDAVVTQTLRKRFKGEEPAAKPNG